MPKIISVHSFRGGTGKSNTTANLATLFAMQGMRVAVIDTDIQSPGIHVLFGVNEEQNQHSLNDYLWRKCEIEQAAQNVTASLGGAIKGQIFLIPSSIDPTEIARVLREGYDPGLLSDGFNQLIDELNLDVLMIDTHPGLNEETLLSIAISNALLIILRPDQQDYQGTGVTIAVARKLNVPNTLLLVNKVPATFDPEAIKAKVEQTYDCAVAAVLPHSDQMMELASAGVFVVRYPDHPMTELFKQVLARVQAETRT